MVWTPAGARADDADLLRDYSPADAAYLALREIPQVVYRDRPDSLLVWLNAWEAAGGPGEPIMRLRILGAIWDGAFSEALYPDDLMDELLAFSLDPNPIPLFASDLSDSLQRSLALGDSPSLATVKRDFAEFSTAFADQLLPHVPLDSPEEFFCLLYAGRTDRAWSLLADDTLAGTDLKTRRDARVRKLEKVLPSFMAVEGGYWSAFEKYAFAGNHALVGLQVGVRRRPWFARLLLETRLGRTDQPYFVDSGDIQGISDRFSAVLAGAEFGRSWGLLGPLSLEGFGGIGLDGVKPLKDEDLVLGALHLDVGAGLRLDLDTQRKWFAAVTVRREWIRPRNTRGTDLWGDAWSVRMALGLNFEAEPVDELDLMRP